MLGFLFLKLISSLHHKKTYNKENSKSYIVFAGDKSKDPATPFIEEWTQPNISGNQYKIQSNNFIQGSNTQNQLNSKLSQKSYIQFAGSCFQTSQYPFSDSILSERGFHFISYINQNSDKTIFNYNLFYDDRYIRTRKVRFLPNSCPFVYLDSFTADISVTENSDDCEFVEVLGYLPNRWENLFISNKNNETYIFDHKNLHEYYNDYCILILYSEPVNVSIYLSSVGSVDISTEFDSTNIDDNGELIFTNIHSIFIHNQYGFSGRFKIKIERTTPVYKNPTYPYEDILTEYYLNQMEIVEKSKISSVVFSGKKFEYNFDEKYGFQLMLKIFLTNPQNLSTFFIITHKK